MNLVKIKKLHPDAILPTYGSETAAGADLYAVLDAPITIAPHETKVIPTGVACEIPVGLVTCNKHQLCDHGIRSQSARKKGEVHSAFQSEQYPDPGGHHA